MIVTTVLSLWTKDSRPEKFDFASFMFITVGMVILSFSREEEDAGIMPYLGQQGQDVHLYLERRKSGFLLRLTS